MKLTKYTHFGGILKDNLPVEVEVTISTVFEVSVSFLFKRKQTKIGLNFLGSIKILNMQCLNF